MYPRLSVPRLLLCISIPATGVDADLYYLGLFASEVDTLPYTLVTSATPTATIEDLLPNTTYILRWRPHPKPAQDVGPVWGWLNHSTPVVIKTIGVHKNAVARRIRRVGKQPSTDSIKITWEWTNDGAKQHAAHRIVLVGVQEGDWPTASMLPSEDAVCGTRAGWAWSEHVLLNAGAATATTTMNPVVLVQNLKPGKLVFFFTFFW